MGRKIKNTGTLSGLIVTPIRFAFNVPLLLNEVVRTPNVYNLKSHKIMTDVVQECDTISISCRARSTTRFYNSV